MRDLDAYYILDGETVRKTTRDAAYEWLLADKSKKIIAQEDVGRFHVSTVFLIHDHAFDDESPPIVFETMVFGRNADGSLDMTGEFTDRCATLAEAKAMHAKTCECVRSGKLPEHD